MDWTALRDGLPVTLRWAFLDHAAVAPMTSRACRTLQEWATDVTMNGVVCERDWLPRVEETRRKVGQLLNADPQDIAFVKNTSEGIGFVAEGLDWRPGENVVIAEEEYPANVYPWMNLRDRGVETRRVQSRGARIELDDLAAAIDAKTRIVSLSVVEFASGFRNDIDAIGALCRERGILFFVDAIQGLGVLPFDVQRTPVDFLAADGHKWLLGPEGAGVFWIRHDLIERLHTVSVGWNSVMSAWEFSKIDFRLKPNAGRWESGTLNIGGIAALGASVGWLLDIGIDVVSRRVMELTDYLCDRVLRAGFGVFSSRREGDRSGIVSLLAPEPKAVMRRCREAGIVVNVRSGRLRVSPHCYNTFEEIDRLMEAMSRNA